VTRQPEMNELEQGDLTLLETRRPVILATQGVISSGHYLTSMAGMRILLNSGNAFDAMAAAGFAAAVVEPIASYSLAAEGVFMLYHHASGDLLSLSGQGVAPGRATTEFYRSQGLERIPTGPGLQAPLSFTVPGVVDGFITLLEKYGTKTIEEVLAPAIQYAEYGIPHYDYMLERLKSPATRQQFQFYPPGGSEVFYNDGKVPRPGSLLVQKSLAHTLKQIAGSGAPAPASREEGLRAARHVFYQGEVARTIADCSQSVGGILDLEDLSNYRAKYEAPVKTTFKGYEIWGHNSWTQGPILMQALNMLEGIDLRGMGHNSPAYIHTVTEVFKLAFADREAYYGDPDFASVPMDGLLAKDYGAQRGQQIDPTKAYPGLPAAGDPWRYSKMAAKPSPVRVPTSSAAPAGDDAGEDGTTHVAVLDREGNMVCGTISGGSFGSSVFFPQLGCTLSTRIEMFNCQEGHPNEVEPGKRPRTTLVNYIVCEDGHPIMTIGCPGGDNQCQANLQIFLNTVLFATVPTGGYHFALRPEFQAGLSIGNLNRSRYGAAYPRRPQCGKQGHSHGVPLD